MNRESGFFCIVMLWVVAVVLWPVLILAIS